MSGTTYVDMIETSVSMITEGSPHSTQQSCDTEVNEDDESDDDSTDVSTGDFNAESSLDLDLELSHDDTTTVTTEQSTKVGGSPEYNDYRDHSPKRSSPKGFSPKRHFL